MKSFQIFVHEKLDFDQKHETARFPFYIERKMENIGNNNSCLKVLAGGALP